MERREEQYEKYENRKTISIEEYLLKRQNQQEKNRYGKIRQKKTVLSVRGQNCIYK